jgi:serine/threonine protein phosphatase 1
MKYYITADVHGFYTDFHKALYEVGYFNDPEPHKLIILGDIFDRGPEAGEMQRFILELMEQAAVILIRGNHEDLFAEMVTVDEGLPVRHHVSNGTYSTALQLTGYDPTLAQIRHWDFAEKAQETPFYQRIIPATIDWYETAHYVFTHGWIPCIRGWDGSYSYDPNWRDTGPEGWRMARWYNGMDAAQSCKEEKTILCGHWHSSYGHSKYEGKGSEFGPDADFSPYYGPGVIALDAYTAYSGKVNVIVIEDEDLPSQDAEDERFREVTQRILEEHKAAFVELAK